jgi:hypothetical protein
MQRRRSSPHSLEDQITAQKTLLENKLTTCIDGPERDVLMMKIRDLENAIRMNGWLRSRDLKSPE